MAPPVKRALDSLRARWRFDLVHAHSVIPPGFAAARWRGSRPDVALAVSTHGPDVISDYARSRWAGHATAAAFDAADVVIANSAWAADRCEAIAGHTLPVQIVHLGADPPPVPTHRRERRTIVTLAHLEARKRHAVVLYALAALPEAQRPDYLVIGDGPTRPGLTRLADQLGVADRVQFTGQLDNQRALAELARCHLFVMPSIREPFGVAYVEAMAAGLPAIATRGEGGPEDIAAAGDGIILVPRDDHLAVAAAIADALLDPATLHARGAAARENVARHFTWAQCGRQTVAAYERALAARASRR
jgi:glycosyltransferase involved in cell wall biosynthesis